MVLPTDLSNLKNSTFSNDFLDYENITQNALNKKILKWKNQWIKYNGMDKYSCKYYLKKEFDTEVRLIWLQYLYFIKLNLVVIEKFYQKRKIECEIFNKQQHAVYLKQQIKCECGATYTQRNKQAHFKTNKHLSKGL
jgi:hypothetical protein